MLSSGPDWSSRPVCATQPAQRHRGTATDYQDRENLIFQLYVQWLSDVNGFCLSFSCGWFVKQKASGGDDAGGRWDIVAQETLRPLDLCPWAHEVERTGRVLEQWQDSLVAALPAAYRTKLTSKLSVLKQHKNKNLV